MTKPDKQWTDVQITAARAIAAIERNDPKCPECGAGVLRHKCLYELDPSNCPRHEAATQIQTAIRQIETLGQLPRMWRYEMPLFERIGPISGELLNKLKWMTEQLGGKFKSPGIVPSLEGLVSRGIVGLSSGGAGGPNFNYSLDRFGLDYIEAMKRQGLWDSKEEAAK